MNNFTFKNETEMIFGKNTQKQVGELTARYGKKVLIHYGGGSIKKSGLYDEIIESLHSEKVDFVELGGVVANPRLSLVQQGIEICRREKVDFILAIGGGSVIDSAKTIAAGAVYDGNCWDFFIGKAPVTKSLPLGVVLTIPAAGSETSNSAVITNEEGWFKKGMGGPTLRPVFAVLNPELTYTLPDYQTACGVSDMLAHVMERYFSNTKNVELTDRLCEGIMKTIVHQGLRVINNPMDYDARAEIMLAGTIAHNDLAGVGREQDWASHNIEHELSGIYDIAHGAGLSIVFPAWIKYNYPKNPEKFAQFAHRVFDVEYQFERPIETIEKGIEALEHFYIQMGLPIRLKDVQIYDNRFEEMANKATDHDAYQIGGLNRLSSEDIIKIYELCV